MSHETLSLNESPMVLVCSVCGCVALCLQFRHNQLPVINFSRLSSHSNFKASSGGVCVCSPPSVLEKRRDEKCVFMRLLRRAGAGLGQHGEWQSSASTDIWDRAA